jgi:hypothetical protein
MVRLGFQYEGLFRQAMITRGRNRDTAWLGRARLGVAVTRPLCRGHRGRASTALSEYRKPQVRLAGGCGFEPSHGGINPLPKVIDAASTSFGQRRFESRLLSQLI